MRRFSWQKPNQSNYCVTLHEIPCTTIQDPRIRGCSGVNDAAHTCWDQSRCEMSGEQKGRDIPGYSSGIPMINIQVGREVGKIAKRVARKKSVSSSWMILFFFNVWLWDGLKMVGCSAIIFFGLQVLLSFWVSITRCFRAKRVAGAELGVYQ